MIVFCDRCLGRNLPRALRAEGKNVEMHDDHFVQDEGDDVWLAEVGRRGWVVVTKDDRIRFNALERAAWQQHKVGCFTLIMKNATGQQMLDVLLAHWERLEAISDSEPRPFLYSLYRHGRLHKHTL